jgi:hypothetical protein
LSFKCFLAITQRGLIGLDLMRTPTDFRRFLRGHAATVVQVYWVAIHTPCAFPSL